jgi:hypothetical protein
VGDFEHHQPAMAAQILNGFCRTSRTLPTAVAKPLQRGVIYQISTTTGATGYGGGRFVIQSDGRVVNMP